MRYLWVRNTLRGPWILGDVVRFLCLCVMGGGTAYGVDGGLACMWSVLTFCRWTAVTFYGEEHRPTRRQYRHIAGEYRHVTRMPADLYFYVGLEICMAWE